MRRAGVLMAIACAVVIGAPAAHAETAYRYWSYWTVRDDAWSFATLGPASALPADGAVEGWRFAVTTEQAGAQDAPRVSAASAFTDICGSTAPVDGSKRIAVVIDFGDPSDAPGGEQPPAQTTACVVDALDASGYEVLSTVADVRTQDGLVCGLEGYPRSGCADIVDAAATPASASPASSIASTTPAQPPATAPTLGGGWAMLVSALALLGAAIVGAVLWKRRAS
jgi:hypothetical protein